MVSVMGTQLCHLSRKASIEQCANKGVTMFPQSSIYWVFTLPSPCVYGLPNSL